MPSRADTKYEEIEQFKDYELIHCVAYEMAVRAPKIQEILIGKSYYDKKRPNSEHGILYPTDKNKEIQKIFSDHGLSISEVLNLDRRSPDRTYKTGSIQSFFVECTPNGLSKSSASTEGVASMQWKGYIEDKPTHERKFIKTPEITLHIARPALELPTPNKASIEINFSLPLSEIQAQIAQIKSEVEKSNTAIVSPKDLLGSVDYTDGDRLQKKPRAHRFADWFFAYDLYQILKAKRNPAYTDKGIFEEIDRELYFYYGEDHDKYHNGGRVYSDTYYRKTIMPIMRHFIEDFGYKHLI